LIQLRRGKVNAPFQVQSQKQPKNKYVFKLKEGSKQTEDSVEH